MDFQGAWNPIVMKIFRDPSASERFERVFTYYLFVVAMILVWLSLFGREILLLLTPKVFSEGYVVVPTLIPCLNIGLGWGVFHLWDTDSRKIQLQVGHKFHCSGAQHRPEYHVDTVDGYHWSSFGNYYFVRISRICRDDFEPEVLLCALQVGKHFLG